MNRPRHRTFRGAAAGGGTSECAGSGLNPKAQTSNPVCCAGDWLVGQIQALVEVGFRMATGTAEALRPTGLALQAALLRRFGTAADPLQPGARLLAQYQAQLVSSLRRAGSASPLAQLRHLHAGPCSVQALPLPRPTVVYKAQHQAQLVSSLRCAAAASLLSFRRRPRKCPGTSAAVAHC